YNTIINALSKDEYHFICDVYGVANKLPSNSKMRSNLLPVIEPLYKEAVKNIQPLINASKYGWYATLALPIGYMMSYTTLGLAVTAIGALVSLYGEDYLVNNSKVSSVANGAMFFANNRLVCSGASAAASMVDNQVTRAIASKAYSTFFGDGNALATEDRAISENTTGATHNF
ncbi:unnamed protein product, partial [marine sediment metagenome]